MFLPSRFEFTLMETLWFQRRPPRGFHLPKRTAGISSISLWPCEEDEALHHDIFSFPALPLKQWRDDCFGKWRDCSSMVPKLRQRDLKPLHSWFSEDTQPRANWGFYSTLPTFASIHLHFRCQEKSGFLLSVFPESTALPLCAQRLGLVSRLREPSGLIESCIF